jgi:DNA-binding response OmpR family regulator
MKKVLIIEDDPDIVDILTLILEKEGYKVGNLPEFAGYKNSIGVFSPDLVLLDINLGAYNGKDICKFMKAQAELKHIPVILMSANMDLPQSKVEAGADAFLTKPFELAELTYAIRTGLNNGISLT